MAESSTPAETASAIAESKARTIAAYEAAEQAVGGSELCALLEATIQALADEREAMITAYGNAGCGQYVVPGGP